MTTTALHEALIDLIRFNPDQLVACLRGTAALSLPIAPARVVEADVPQHVPPPLHSDLVLELGAGSTRAGLIVEVQTRPDRAKRRVWPLYFAHLHARLGHHVFLVVIALNPKVARWAARGVRFAQPGTHFTPIVLGPTNLPRITDAVAARKAPGLAILANLVHAGHNDADLPIPTAAALSTLPADRAKLYTELFARRLSETARALLESTMSIENIKIEYTFAPFKKYEDEIRRRDAEIERRDAEIERRDAEIKRARAVVEVIQVLTARGLSLTPAEVNEIVACSDLDQIRLWLCNAGNAGSVSELLRTRAAGT